MDNQQFPHFVWGIHEDSSKKFYALMSLTSSKFFLVSEDYSLLKLLQFIFLPSKHFVLVTLTDTKNYELNMIDNSVCLKWTIESTIPFSRLGAGFAGTYKGSNTLTLLYQDIEPSDEDLNLQKNLFAVMKVLKVAEDFVKSQLNDQVDLEHYVELIKFCKMVIPNDHNIIDIINIDYQSMLNLKNKIEDCWNQIVRLLASLDYNQPYEKLVGNFKTAVEDLDRHSAIKSEFKKSMLLAL